MRKIIRLTERDLTKLIKRVLVEEHSYTFEDVLDKVHDINQYFPSFFSNLQKHKTTEEHNHPNFPLEHMIKYVLDFIKENEYEAEYMFNRGDLEDNFIYAFFYRNSRSIDSWWILYCQFKYYFDRKEPEICKHEDDINWDIVKQETGQPEIKKGNDGFNLNEPRKTNIGNNTIYDTFNDAYNFAIKLDEFLEELAPSNKVCDKKHLVMLNILLNTSQIKINELVEKYKNTPRWDESEPAERSVPSGSDEEKINRFLEKYINFPDDKFYEMAKEFSNETGISVETVREKRMEKFKKTWGKILKPKNYEKDLKKDPEYNQANEIEGIARKWLHCCRKGKYDCDDDPPRKYDGPIIRPNELNISYTPIGGGDSTNTPSNPMTGGEREMMRESIKRILRTLS
jgi:hypothetical protein